MDKEELISLAEKIKQALNAISVSGYSNLRTLANCMDALTELEKRLTLMKKISIAQLSNRLKNLQILQLQKHKIIKGLSLWIFKNQNQSVLKKR